MPLPNDLFSFKGSELRGGRQGHARSRLSLPSQRLRAGAPSEERRAAVRAIQLPGGASPECGRCAAGEPAGHTAMGLHLWGTVAL